MKRDRAFTLIELVITLLILATVVMLVIPIARDFIERNRLTSTVYQLLAALNLGKISAIHSGKVVTLCKSRDGKQCLGDWSDGQILFIDEHANGMVDANDDIIRVWQSIKSGIKLDWRGFYSNTYIQMDPSGIGQTMNGNFLLCPASKNDSLAQTIIISRSGRARVSQVDSQGQPLHCGTVGS